MKKIAFILFIIISLLLTGCTDNKTQDNTDGTTGISDSPTSSVDVLVDNSDMFTNRDYEVGYDEKECVNIILNGDTAACDSESVVINQNIITITEEAAYIISGELADGMIIIEADDNDKPQIILNNASVKSSNSAPLYVKTADKVFVTLADNSVNTLGNGGEFVSIDDNNIDGAVFSKQDITFNGNGSLDIVSSVGHGIVCKDDVVFTSGSYKISSAFHGVDANDSVRIANANIQISAGKDGIHVENSDNAEKGFLYYFSGNANITAEGDGISSGLYTELIGGEINITAGGGSINGTKTSSDNYGGFMGGGPGGFDPHSTAEATDEDSVSMKGIKTQTSLIVEDCKITVDSADDSIHSNADITINGGEFNLSSGDDAIHAEENLDVNGGNINISESYEGLEAHNILINDGDISLVSSDDGLNAAGGTDESGFGGRDNGGFGGQENSNGSIIINGGNIYIEASGDGIDANGYLEIHGGYTEVCGPTTGDTAVLDYDTTAEITGGTFVGTGSYMMAQTFSSSENQGVLALSVGNQEALTEIVITDSNGNDILKYSPKLSYAILIYSSPEIKTGESYKVHIGNETGEFIAS